jgi:hypothetical protein
MKSDINKLADYLQVIEFVQAMTPQLQGAQPARVHAGDDENAMIEAE